MKVTSGYIEVRSGSVQLNHKPYRDAFTCNLVNWSVDEEDGFTTP